MELKKQGHPEVAWVAVVIIGLILGGLVQCTTNIDKVEFKVNVEQVGQVPVSSEDRFNAILADNGPSNYGDDLFKIQQH